MNIGAMDSAFIDLPLKNHRHSHLVSLSFRPRYGTSGAMMPWSFSGFSTPLSFAF